MKFINRADFSAKINGRFAPEKDAWLCNYFVSVFKCFSHTLSCRVKFETLIKKTQRLVALFNSEYPIYAFPDGIAGWRDVPRNRRLSPVQIFNTDELADLLRTRIYFRDPEKRVDNYHITDRDMSWVVVFSHHNDWHLYAPRELLDIAIRNGITSKKQGDR